MSFIPTIIPDVILIEPKVFADERGFVLESYQKQRFTAAGIPFDFVQDNHSKSQQGVLRGLHYQIQQAQGKLVRVIAGEVFDVAVDIRKSSPTFGKWVGEFLSADNKKMLWVPAGFAHGIYVISLLKCSIRPLIIMPRNGNARSHGMTPRSTSPGPYMTGCPRYRPKMKRGKRLHRQMFSNKPYENRADR